jgi:hypothetical protein
MQVRRNLLGETGGRVKRHSYATGTQHGCWRVIEKSFCMEAGEPLYQCQCVSCFRIDVLTIRQLQNARCNGQTRCKHCKNNGSLVDRHHGCQQCEGQSWRRPENGKPCLCGEMFSDEIIARVELVHSSAGFDNVAVNGRRFTGIQTVNQVARIL